MTERVGSEAIAETFRLRLAARGSLRRAALGFLASMAILLALTLALSAAFDRKPNRLAAELRGAVTD